MSSSSTIFFSFSFYRFMLSFSPYHVLPTFTFSFSSVCRHHYCFCYCCSLFLAFLVARCIFLLSTLSYVDSFKLSILRHPISSPRLTPPRHHCKQLYSIPYPCFPLPYCKPLAISLYEATLIHQV